MIRCEACGTATPAYDIVNYGSIEKGYRHLCSQCFNSDVASRQGLDRFENIRFDHRVGRNDGLPHASARYRWEGRFVGGVRAYAHDFRGIAVPDRDRRSKR